MKYPRPTKSARRSSVKTTAGVFSAIFVSAILFLGMPSLIARAQDNQSSDAQSPNAQDNQTVDTQSPDAQDSQAPESTEKTLSFPIPVANGTMGVKAPGAMREVSAHIQAVSATGWQDLEATGTLTFPEGDTHSATLYLLGSTYSRLDIEMDSGTRSLRIQNHIGNFQDEFGNSGSLLLSATNAGVVALPKVWIDATASSQIALTDQGTYPGTGQNLHRITLQTSLFKDKHTPSIPDMATDLYFDPNTHLLLYSVDSVTFSNSNGQMFSQVTSYSNYQQFNGHLFPTTIQQTLNGQPLWTLQVSQVTFNTNPSASTFSF